MGGNGYKSSWGNGSLNYYEEQHRKLTGASKAMNFGTDGYDYIQSAKQTVEMAKRESIDRSLFEETGINPRGED